MTTSIRAGTSRARSEVRVAVVTCTFNNSSIDNSTTFGPCAYTGSTQSDQPHHESELFEVDPASFREHCPSKTMARRVMLSFRT